MGFSIGTIANELLINGNNDKNKEYADKVEPLSFFFFFFS